jgi:hypothetical protein
MSFFLIDANCAYVPIPEMNWKWTHDLLPIHVYFFAMCIREYHEYFYYICDFFWHHYISYFFSKPFRALLGEALETIQEIAN